MTDFAGFAAAERAELKARFERIKAHYAPYWRAMRASPDEWVLDPYAWEGTNIRIHLTPIEQALWSDIRMENAVMYPQIPVGPFFVDFGNPGARVAIECDGEAWHRDKKKDADRDWLLNARGWSVYRIPGKHCFAEITETEDMEGNVTVTPSIARKFIRDICDRHPIRRYSLRERPARPMSLCQAFLPKLDNMIEELEEGGHA